MQVLDASGLAVLVNSACNTTSHLDPKPFARKVGAAGARAPLRRSGALGTRRESVHARDVHMHSSAAGGGRICLTRSFETQESTRLLGLLAAPSCPMREAALQPPVLTKALAHIKKHMQVRGRQGSALCKVRPRRLAP